MQPKQNKIINQLKLNNGNVQLYNILISIIKIKKSIP